MYVYSLFEDAYCYCAHLSIQCYLENWHFLLENRYGKFVKPEINLLLVKYEISALISYFVIRPIFLRGPCKPNAACCAWKL